MILHGALSIHLQLQVTAMYRTNEISKAHKYTHTFNGPLSGTTRMSQYQKSKTNLDFLKQETVSGSGIS